jgi:hypothetical protein
MADEISVTETIRISKSSFKDSISPGQITFDMAGSGGGNPGLVDIGTSEEDIAFGDVTPSTVWMQNLDATNYVQIGPKSGGAMIACIKLLAGETSRIQLESGVTLRAKANTAACKVMIKGY